MKRTTWIIPLLLLVITACSPQATAVSTEEALQATAELPTPRVNVTPAPDIQSAVAGFMEAWNDDNYAAMYGLLTTEIQGVISEADFLARYRDAAAALTLQLEDGIDYEILQSVINPDTAVATLQVDY